jgi:hypothetical protein
LKFSRLLLFCLVFLFASTAFSQIYEWVDENGVKRYSDRPPPKGTQIIKQYDEIITENEDITLPPATKNTQQKHLIDSSGDKNLKPPKQAENDRKGGNSSDDSQDSETVTQLKKALENKITSSRRRKLLRRLKAAEAKEKQKSDARD